MALLIETKRTQILDGIAASLRRIKRGDTVRTGGVEKFQHTVRRVAESRLPYTELPDEQLPAILFLNDDQTSFGLTAEASYEGEWRMTILLVTKDRNRPKVGKSRQSRILEGLFRDVGLALHSGERSLANLDSRICVPNCGGLSVNMEYFDIESIHEPAWGIASVGLLITYTESFAVQ